MSQRAVWIICIFIGWLAAAWLGNWMLPGLLSHASQVRLPDTGQVCPVIFFQFHRYFGVWIDTDLFYLKLRPCLTIWAIVWPWMVGGPLVFLLFPGYRLFRPKSHPSAAEAALSATPKPLPGVDFRRPAATVAVAWVVLFLIAIVVLPLLYRGGFFS